ncbi:nuclear matrix constituent protein 1a [Gossypium raimondii]|uniref:nuclear matrix constituent protein 1a n=1 Tax=Gossypium raimondii TaxID=29730 RepID=UPI00063A9EC6|nr:nuclear matrix constituent protein 1a [Gossypium raimondii]
MPQSRTRNSLFTIINHPYQVFISKKPLKQSFQSYQEIGGENGYCFGVQESTQMKEKSPSAMASVKGSVNKEEEIESLKMEVGKNEESDKEASFNKMKDESGMVKSSESDPTESLSEDQQRIHQLSEQIKERQESEKKIYDSYVAQSKEFEQAKVSLEHSKNQINSLLENLQKWEHPSNVSFQTSLGNDHLKRLELELQFTKEKLVRAQEDEQASSLRAKNLTEEVNFLKSEMKFIADAEENNKKAMDDLALALKEVITEANEAKNKLSATQFELEKTKGLVENLKMKLKMVEGKYNEAKKEADRYKNTSERLRIEAEESLMAWNTREIGFVDCIRKAEDERNAAKDESKALLESLEEAENMNKKAKEENQKLRDIMKQAINEANVAKEAANIAREENSQLKDSIAKKDEALNFLSQENETLKINEAAACEMIKELKQLRNKGV